MRVDIGSGTRLLLDIEGAKLVPDGSTMRERPALKNICPTFVLAGDLDPIALAASAEDLAAALSPTLVRHEFCTGCGHGVDQDDPVRAFGANRDFIRA